MKLVHIDLNGKQSEVSIGFCFDHDKNDLEVVWMPEPHKPSSSGKVTCMNHTTNESEPEDYAQVYSMKWIEREDQGWIHHEIELRAVLTAYENMYDDDISGLNLESVIYMIKQVDLEHLSKYPEYAKLMLNWLEKNDTPNMLKE